jgi:N-methylhydantoinase B
MKPDPIRLEVYKNLFAAVAEEMGVVLRKASYSPNIKERRDYSCAIFDAQGHMIAQAAHIPVHLGSMPLSVRAAIENYHSQNEPGVEKSSVGKGLHPGDSIILNDPYQGGTHLPDITLVTPVFVRGMTKEHSAGSMPIAREIFQEGLIIPPIKLYDRGQLNQAAWDLILANVRTPLERSGDLMAQIAANQRGSSRFQELVMRYGFDEISTYMDALLAYTERMTRHLLEEIPDGSYKFEDYLDDDGIGSQPILISVTITIEGDNAKVDFSESAVQQKGSMNAVLAITLSAVYYVFRCLLGLDVPNNSGCLRPIQVIAPHGRVVNATSPAPVAGGNVETSQRIVDVLLGALAQAYPGRIPAASQGTMNNVTIGGWDESKGESFTYYETIGGGLGALSYANGLSAHHSHMTNTLNTPVEALEYAYPLKVLRYEIRKGSGGKGKFSGGDGIIRELETLVDAQVTLLTDRRRLSPYGLYGGSPGTVGENILIRGENVQSIPSKGTINLQKGDKLLILTPGGGGYGEEE